MRRFILVKAFPNGHSFFIDRCTGRIAVADKSGPTPDQTDDGVLYATFDVRPGGFIGLVDPDGRGATSPAPADECAWVAGFAEVPPCR